MKNYILSINDSDRTLLSSLIGTHLVSMAMYDDERAAYVLQFFLSNGKTVTIRGTGKDIPNEGDVILDLHSFTVFESDVDPACATKIDVGKTIRAIYVTVASNSSISWGKRFAFENLIEIAFDDGTSIYLFADNTLSDSIRLFHSESDLRDYAKEDYVFMETKEPDSVITYTRRALAR